MSLLGGNSSGNTGSGLFGNSSSGNNNSNNSGGNSGGLFGNNDKKEEKKGGLFGSSNNQNQQKKKNKMSDKQKLELYLKKREEIARERTSFDKAQWNSAEFLSLFNNIRGEEFENQLSKLLSMDEIRLKYSQLAGYFKPYKEEDVKKVLEEKKIKGVFNKFKVTPALEMTIKKVAEDINLNIYQTYRLIEDYIFENVALLMQINKGIEPSLLNKITIDCGYNFFYERGSALKTLSTILFYSHQVSLNYNISRANHKFAFGFIDDLIQNRHLVKNLWINYKKLKKYKIPNAFKEDERTFYSQILSEQIWILRIMYRGFSYEIFECDEAMYLEMLKTFREEDFTGQFVEISQKIGLEAESFRDKCETISNFSSLVLIAALNLDPLIEGDMRNFINVEKAPFKLFSRDSINEISEIITEIVEDNNSDLIIRIGHVLKTLINFFDVSSARLRELKEDKQITQNQDKLDTLHRSLIDKMVDFNSLGEIINEEHAIRALLGSHFYKSMPHVEGNEIRMGIKKIIGLKILPKSYKDSSSFLQFDYHELVFIGDTICECLKNEAELSDYIQNEKNPFRNFEKYLYSYFPINEEILAKLLKRVAGSQKIDDCEAIIKDLAAMNFFTAEGIYKQIKYQMVNNTRQYETRQDFQLPNGPSMPKGTPFTLIPSTEISVFSFPYSYNYLHVIWKDWTNLVIEGQIKGASIDTRLSRYIKLICKIIELKPNLTYQLQCFLLDQENEMDKKQSDQFIAPIVFLILDTLCLLSESVEEIGLTLALTKALNAILMTSFNTQATVAIQIYQSMSISASDDRKIHPVISLVNLFHAVENEVRSKSTKIEKAGMLVLEILKLFEIIINISDYIYEVMPSFGFYNKQKMTKIRRNENDLRDFVENYYEFMNNEASVDLANRLNIAYKRLLEAHGASSGCLLAPTTFIEDGLKILVKEFMSYIQDSRFDAYDSCVEIKFLIGYKLMAIINNLLCRFKIEPGREISLESGSSSLELQQIASFFNSMNLEEFLFQIFDVSVKNDIFLGEREALGNTNKLGIENLYWTRQEFISNVSYVGFALQRFFVETLETFNTIIELIQQRKFYMKKSSDIQNLNIIHEMTNSLCDPDKLYSYRLKSIESDFQINFFLSLVLMTDFNFEKSIAGLETHHPDFYFVYYSLPSTDTYILYDYFVLKNFQLAMNYSSIFSSGRYTQVCSSNSVSEAVVVTLTKLLNLWGNVRSFKKPILNQILIGNGVSNNFAGKIKVYVYSNLITHLYRAAKRPLEAAATLEFLVECFKTQKSFFDGFVKYCAKLRERTPALNELVDIFKKIVSFFEENEPNRILSMNSYIRIIIAMTQIISIVFLKGEIYHELTDQIRKYVLQDLARLLTKLVTKRRDPFQAILSCSIETLIGADNTFCEINNSYSDLSIMMLKIREMVDIETKLNFTIGLFLKVARSEFLFKVSGELHDYTTEIKPPLFDNDIIEMMNNLLNDSTIKIDKVLNEIDTHFFMNYINDGDIEDGAMEEEGMKKYGLVLFRDEKVRSSKKVSLLEPNFDEGIEFDGKDALRRLRESGYDSVKINTILYAVSFYNNLNKIKKFRYEAIKECNHNLTLASSLGFNGIMFSTIMHQDPLSNVVRFVVSLENQSEKKFSMFKNLPENEHIYSYNIINFDDVSISSKMKEIINPFFSRDSEESIIKLLGGAEGGKLSDETLKNCFGKLCKHIGDIKKTLDELVTTFEEELKSREINLIPYRISKILCEVASNYFVTMGYLVTNLYYLKPDDSGDKAEESCYTLMTFLKTVNKLSDYLQKCFSTLSLDIYPQIHCIFTALTNLSHFKDVLNYSKEAKNIIHIVVLLEKIIFKKGETSPLFSLALNCFNLILDIEPVYLTKEHVERLLKMMNRERISNADYMSICQFLITSYSCSHRRRVVIESRILQAILEISKFNKIDSFSDATFYNKELRNSKQMVWCWTLQLAIVSFKAVSSSMVRFKYAVSFLNKYQNRIMMILSYKFQDIDKVFENNRRVEMGLDSTQSLPFRTNAYLEELQLTMTLVSIVMKNSLDFKKLNKNLFEKIFYLLTNRTVLLFKRDNCSPDTFKAVSWLEIALQKITLESGAKERISQLARNPSTMKKLTARKSSYRSDFGGNRSIRSRADLYAGAYSRIYTPDLFSFKTEIQFLNIVFLLFDCLVYSIEHSEFYNYFEKEDIVNFEYNSKQKTKKIKVAYHDSFWKHFSNALVEVQSYLISSLMKLGTHYDTYKEGIIQLVVFNQTVENSFNNFVLNILNPQLKISKLQEMSFAALEMSMYVQNVVFQHLDNLSIYGSSKMIETIRIDKIKSSNLINELQWLERKSIAYKSSIVKNSMNSNLDLPTVEEEETEDRYFLAFLKKYYLN